MDPKHLARLKEEQKIAIDETDAKLEQLQQFKKEYVALHDQLKTLPDKLSHDIMVPFGKLAFMPGKIVHTNEILVLLGDNWFVERSARQAAEIADRRIKELDKKLSDLESQRKLLEPRLNFTTDLQAELQGAAGVNEIVEKYDEEQEKLWDEKHRQNVKRHKEELRRIKESQNSSEKKEVRDEKKSKVDLWSRLDELERLENERGELESEDDQVSHVESSSLKPGEQRVSWEDIQSNGRSNSVKHLESDESSEEGDDDDDNEDDDDDDNEEDDDDNEEDDEDNDENVEERPLIKKITFSHTPTPEILPHQVFTDGATGIHSPADIYKLFSPKPILKKTLEEATLHVSTECCGSILDDNHLHEKPPQEGDTLSNTALDQESFRSAGARKAFTGVVFEKSVEQPETLPMCSTLGPGTANHQTQEDAPKRISKFKAGRMMLNPSQ